jgi:hypothetical protein
VKVFLTNADTQVDVTAYDTAGQARTVIMTNKQSGGVVGFATDDGSALISGLLVSHAAVADSFVLTEVTVVASSTPKGCCA